MYIYIDSNVIVSAEIPSESTHNQSKAFMEFAERIHSGFPDVRFATSVFTFLELASAMIRRTNNQDKTLALLYRVSKRWQSWMEPFAPIDPKKSRSFEELVDSLIVTAVKFHTPSGDTIHAQTIYLYDFGYLVTWNKSDFQGMLKEMKKLVILTPQEMCMQLRGLTKGRTTKTVTPRVMPAVSA